MFLSLIYLYKFIPHAKCPYHPVVTVIAIISGNDNPVPVFYNGDIKAVKDAVNPYDFIAKIPLVPDYLDM